MRAYYKRRFLPRLKMKQQVMNAPARQYERGETNVRVKCIGQEYFGLPRLGGFPLTTHQYHPATTPVSTRR